MPTSSDDPGGGTPSLCHGSKARGSAASALDPKIVPITGPYEPLPRDDSDYQEAVFLKSQIEGIGVAKPAPATKAGSIPPPVRDALIARWPPLDSKRTELIGQSRPLDADDEALSRFALRLNIWLDNVRRRKPLLDSEASEYNRICLGRPLPDGEFRQCESYRSRFNDCVGRHNASLNERNRLAGVWQDGNNCLTTRGNAFRTRVRDWITLIVKPWIEDARKALSNACDPLVSVSATATPSTIIEPQKTSVLMAEPKYTTTGPDSKPCPTKYKWSPTLTGMGNLNGETSQSVTFTSSGQRGTQDFRVEASDDFSAKVAGVIVTIAGGRVCPVQRTYDRAENKTKCAYQCAQSSPTRYFPGDVPCPQIFDPN